MDGRIKLRVAVSNYNNLRHKWIGKDGSALVRPAMKWNLKINISFSTALIMYAHGGASESSIFILFYAVHD